VLTKISKLLLTDFRNFHSKKLEFSKNLVLFAGQNGVGKTNILEALTMLGRSSTLRSDGFDEMILDDKVAQKKAQQFAIYAEIFGSEVIEKIGISFDLGAKKKVIQINGEPLNVRRQSDIKDHLINFIFLTPKLEQLFILSKSERRDYLDKIVADIDLEHSARVSNYQKSLKERLLILQKYRNQNTAQKWLDAIETQIVELGVAIASARLEAVSFFNKAIESFSSNFPKAQLKVFGEVEEMLESQSAVQLEDFFQQKLRENRAADLENFKTNFGVHRCDFDAIFPEKNALATRSSTGEQKSIMIGITLARAKISASYKNQPTILIFDEVASHLDDKKKTDLFFEINSTNLQAFFSATSADLVPPQILAEDFFEVKNL
jgi:DNA replication and repair protein RecF